MGEEPAVGHIVGADCVRELAALLSAAVDDERVARNPAKGARLPKIEALRSSRSQSSRYTPLHGAPRNISAAPVITAAGTGLRQGELFGLTHDRIDFLRRELRVDQQLWTPPAGSPFLKPPKSRNSYRVIALSTVVIEALAAPAATFGAGEQGLVFHTEGRPVGRSMASKYVRLATRAAGLEQTSWHDFRHHHHASVLLSNGVSPALVAERLGHDVKTLLHTYAHVIRADEDRVRNIVDATLGASAEDLLRTEAG